jgi:aryl-alcohol dehydrogenase-like predicted oxidoreductase
MDRLVLGTAQLGMHYGIANKFGSPSQDEIENLLKSAKEKGVKYLDTAQGYGEAESILGYFNEKLNLANYFKIITKVRVSENIINDLDRSLANLKQNKLYLCLFHEENVLEQCDRTFCEKLANIKSSGKVDGFGVSVYSPDSALKALDIDVIDAIQVPFNILDQRLIKNGFFEKANSLSKEIYIRSIYLQGILLMHKSDIPAKYDFILPYLDWMNELSSSIGLSKQEILLQYVKYKCPKAKLVLGSETLEQFLNNVTIMQHVHKNFNISFENSLVHYLCC